MGLIRSAVNEKQPVQESEPTFKYFDIKAMMYLILDNHKLDSVVSLIDICCKRYSQEIEVLKALLSIVSRHPPLEEIPELFAENCKKMKIKDIDYYTEVFSVVFGDYLETAPHIRGNILIEDSFKMEVQNQYVCDYCGEVINCGERAFIRTIPAPAIRHLKCYSQVRFSKEYIYINYFIREILLFEKIFNSNENKNFYCLPDDNSKHRSFDKNGFLLDGKKFVSLPKFPEFVFDYLSGTDDYELMKTYRPYHIYLELLIAKFVPKQNIHHFLSEMSGYKFLLREDISSEKYSDLQQSINNISYSDLFYEPSVQKMVMDETTKIIYIIAIKKLFILTGIYVDEGKIFVGDEVKSYSVNDNDAVADVKITIDEYGIHCTDFEKSLEIDEYFNFDKEKTSDLIQYINQFGGIFEDSNN